MARRARKTYYRDSDTAKYCATVIALCMAVIVPDSAVFLAVNKHLVPPVILTAAGIAAATAFGALVTRSRKLTTKKEGENTHEEN